MWGGDSLPTINLTSNNLAYGTHSLTLRQPDTKSRKMKRSHITRITIRYYFSALLPTFEYNASRASNISTCLSVGRSVSIFFFCFVFALRRGRGGGKEGRRIGLDIRVVWSVRVWFGGLYWGLLEGWGGERLEGGQARNLEVDGGGGARVGKRERFLL